MPKSSRLCWLMALSAMAVFSASLAVGCEGLFTDLEDIEPRCDTDGDGEFGGGVGSQADPYRICTAEHIHSIGDRTGHLDDHFRLLADIDFGGEKLEPIEFGNDGFEGTFDGWGHSIANVELAPPEDEPLQPVGLFRMTEEAATIQNLQFENVTSSGALSVGTLVGLHRGTIEDVSVTGDVSGALGIGAIAGALEGADASIRNSSVDADVSATSFAGGITGTNQGTIEDVTVSGSVSATGDEMGGGGQLPAIRTTGGAVATNDHRLENVVVDADVFASGPLTQDQTEIVTVGGVAGVNAGEIVTSRAGGDVESSSDEPLDATGLGAVGGLVGSNEGRIDRSVATGSIQLQRQMGGDDPFVRYLAGGLVGRNTGELTDCAATGATEATVDGVVSQLLAEPTAAAALVGEHGEDEDWDDENDNDDELDPPDVDLTITNCYGAGPVADAQQRGGLIAHLGDGNPSVNNSYWDIDTTGVDADKDSGQIGTDLSTEDFEHEGNFTGWDFASTWQIGEAADGEQRPVLQ